MPNDMPQPLSKSRKLIILAAILLPPLPLLVLAYFLPDHALLLLATALAFLIINSLIAFALQQWLHSLAEPSNAPDSSDPSDSSDHPPSD